MSWRSSRLILRTIVVIIAELKPEYSLRLAKQMTSAYNTYGMLKIVQACTSLGSSNPGTEEGPPAITASLKTALAYNKAEYELLEPLVSGTESEAEPTHPSLHNFSRVVDFNKTLYKAITNNATINDRILTLGGDHSVGIGSMSATRAIWPSIKLIYIDAHPDCHEKVQATTSGNIHGFPVSTVLGDGLAEQFGYATYAYRDIAMLGLKDIDSDENEYLFKHQILHLTIDNIIADGIGRAVGAICAWAGDSPIHAVIDIDSIDATEAPGTGIINRGGLNYREVDFVCRSISKLSVRAVDVVEVNPLRDVDGKTVELAAELAATLLGYDWSPYTRYLVQARTNT